MEVHLVLGTQRLLELKRVINKVTLSEARKTITQYRE